MIAFPRACRLVEQGVVTEPHPYKSLLTPQMTMKLKDHR
jgi:hypothetical protein